MNMIEYVALLMPISMPISFGQTQLLPSPSDRSYSKRTSDNGQATQPLSICYCILHVRYTWVLAKNALAEILGEYRFRTRRGAHASKKKMCASVKSLDGIGEVRLQCDMLKSSDVVDVKLWPFFSART